MYLNISSGQTECKTWKERRWGNVRMGVVCGRVEVSEVDDAFRTMHLTRFGTSRRTSRLSVMFFVWTANSVSCGQGIFILAWKMPRPKERLRKRGANSKTLISWDHGRDSCGFRIESDSSEGIRDLIEWRRGTVDSGKRSSRVFHRSQYCANAEMAGWMCTFEEPVQSKRIVSGALRARDIHRFASLFEGRSRVTVIDDHSVSADNAAFCQPTQTCPTSKGACSGLKLDIP